MKMMFFAAIAALTLSVPAMAEADFEGPRVAGMFGTNVIDNGKDYAVYGGQVGYDVEVKGFVLGVTGEYADSDRTGRDIAGTVRVGGSFDDESMFYGLGGYTNLRDNGVNRDGYRLGVGFETSMRGLLVGAEYRFSSYDNNTSNRDETHGLVGTVGLRF